MDARTETRIVEIPYLPRPQFQPYHNSAKRWRIMVCHRRAGKTVATINELIRSALDCKNREPRTAYIAPLYKQAKDVAWSYAKYYGLSVPGAEANESELRIDFPNGARFRLYGADNPDAIRGIYLDACVLDEFADMRPRFLPEVIRPALSDRKGGLTLIGTPKGHNEFWELYEAAKLDDEWFHLMLRASETGLVDADELKSAAKMMSENQYAQEYECSFEAAIEGAYYGALLEVAQREGRIGDYPWRNDLPVYTAWDLGVGDDTSIWFAQRVGGRIHIIDHYFNRGEPASHYVTLVNSKPYQYAGHFLPHDSDRPDGWVNATKRLDTLRQLQLKPITVIPRVQVVDERINAARIILPICCFNEPKVSRGLESLRQHRRAYDEDKRCFLPAPLKDWTSDDADAFSYLAQGMKPEAAIPLDIPRYTPNRRKWRNGSTSSWLTA